jgi:AcrR family transcriptional regulator
MTRHRPTEERRGQILDATLTCLLEEGFHATTVERIAKVAGLSKGAVYFHFESKSALLFALVDAEFQRAEALFDEALAEEGAPIQRAVSAFLSFMGSQGDPRHRFFLLAGEMALFDAELRERLVSQHQRLLDRITGLLSVWAETAQIALPDPEMWAIMIKALSDGLQGSWALGVRVDETRLLGAALALLTLRK